MAAVTAMRHWHRAVRLVSAWWAAPQQAAALSGSAILGLPSYVLPSSSAPLPALQEFARVFSSAYSSAIPRSFEPNDAHEYNKLISTINFRRRPYLHRAVYDDMLMDGVQPVYDTFFLLVKGCMKGSRLQDVMFFFDEMKAMGLTPDVAFYNCVIAACGRSCQVDRAFQVAAEMESSGIQLRHRTFLVLLRCCAIAGQVEKAYGIIRRMAANGFSLDKNFYVALILAHKNHKPHTEEAIQKIFEVLEQSKQQSAEDLMAVAATAESEPDDDVDDGLVMLLSDDIQPRRGFINHRLSVYHAAVKSLSEMGNKEAVKTVLKLVEMDGHEPDSYCVIHLIKCYLAEKDFEQACAEYSKYVDRGKQPTLELYMILIEGALDNHSPTSSAVAQSLLADLLQKGYFLNAQVGSLLLRRACQARSRDIIVANMVWDMMKQREVKVTKFIVQEYFRTLEKSDIPKDDPRFIEVKEMVDAGKRIDFKQRVDSVQRAQMSGLTAPSEQMSGSMATSELVSGQMAPSEQIPGHMAPSEKEPGHMAPSEQEPGHMAPSEQEPGHMAPSEQEVGPSEQEVGPSEQEVGPSEQEVGPSEQEVGYMVPSEQEPGHMAPSGQMSGDMAASSELGTLYSDPNGDEAVDEESPIETENSSEILNSSTAEIKLYEKVR